MVNQIVSRLSRLTPSGRDHAVSGNSEVVDFTPEAELFPQMEAIDALVEESENQDSCEDLATLIKDLETDMNELDAEKATAQHAIEDTA